MTLSELVTAVLLKATGKVTSLTSSDTKYQKVLGIANFYIQQWSNTKDVDWNSLYNPECSTGTVSATKTYELDGEIRKISDTRGDTVQVVLDDLVDEYSIVPADRLKTYAETDKVCAQIGRNLVFRTAFSSDSQWIGADILIPVYTYADSLANAGDEVPVDIPEWLVLMCAAEYVRNDITKQNQYPNLIGEANELMQRMIDDNDAQVTDAPIFWSNNGRTW